MTVVGRLKASVWVVRIAFKWLLAYAYCNGLCEFLGSWDKWNLSLGHLKLKKNTIDYA